MVISSFINSNFPISLPNIKSSFKMFTFLEYNSLVLSAGPINQSI